MTCSDCPHHIASNNTCCHAAIEPVKRVTYEEAQWHLSHTAEFKVGKERSKAADVFFTSRLPYGVKPPSAPINSNAQTIESLRNQWDAHYQQDRYDYESE